MSDARTATVSLRPADPGDREFLLAVYASTREEELAQAQWQPGEQASFVEMQFDAQDAHYRAHYPGAQFWVICVDGEPAGRLYLWRSTTEIRIMDIALLPSYRGIGIGQGLIRGVFAEADRAGLQTGVHVERYNPALRLYERLGFTLAIDRGVYLFMLRPPAASTGSSSPS